MLPSLSKSHSEVKKIFYKKLLHTHEHHDWLIVSYTEDSGRRFQSNYDNLLRIISKCKECKSTLEMDVVYGWDIVGYRFFNNFFNNNSSICSVQTMHNALY